MIKYLFIGSSASVLIGGFTPYDNVLCIYLKSITDVAQIIL